MDLGDGEVTDKVSWLDQPSLTDTMTSTARMHKALRSQYLPKPPAADGFNDNKPPSSYQIPHCMSLDTEELARRAAIYASLADSMVVSVIEELSPKD